MDFLTQQEIRGIKQDIGQGVAKQTTDKYMFEKKLLEGLGEQMMEEMNMETKPSFNKRRK